MILASYLVMTFSILLLLGEVDLHIVLSDWQPGGGVGREASAGGVVPMVGRARRVAGV